MQSDGKIVQIRKVNEEVLEFPRARVRDRTGPEETARSLRNSLKSRAKMSP